MILITLSFSCASHKEKVYKKHIPPTEKGTHAQDQPVQDPGLVHPQSQLSEQKKILFDMQYRALAFPINGAGNLQNQDLTVAD